MFFKTLPTIDYTVGNTTANVHDIMIRYSLVSDILKDPRSYYSYQWKDTDRPDIVAKQYYGDSNYAWLVMLSAGAYDHVYDFPLDSNTFDNWLKQKYSVSDTNVLRTQIDHYKDSDGYVIDQQTYSETGGSIVYVYDLEFQANEAKREIKLLSKEYLKQVAAEYEKNIKQIKEFRSK